MVYKSILLLCLVFVMGCETPQATFINGVELPNVELPTASGEQISLADLRGNIVLVDVWASWCRPCRKENPRLVSLYKRYQNAKFENDAAFVVYSISLDSDKAAWLKAIEQDGLIWPQHVSELTGWKSKAVEAYQLTAIPSSFLIDENGIIIAKDQQYSSIEKILKQRLAK